MSSQLSRYVSNFLMKSIRSPWSTRPLYTRVRSDFSVESKQQRFHYEERL